jgi:hypothetical protein
MCQKALQLAKAMPILTRQTSAQPLEAEQMPRQRFARHIAEGEIP